MAEVDYLRIKSICKSFVALRDSIDRKGGYSVNFTVVANYDELIDQLSAVSRTDYSRYKAHGHIRLGGYKNDKYAADEFHQILSQVIGLLEGQFELEKPEVSKAPVITIDNSNKNEINIAFRSIQQVALEVEDPEVKEKLLELDHELSRASKDTNKIKALTVWLLQRSWEVFLSIAPVLLEKVGKNV